MSAKSRGISRERDVVKLLRNEGWWATRLPASLGSADVLALKRGEPSRLIQVKANQGNIFMHFRPQERMLLELEAEQAGAEPWLVHWPARGAPRWLSPDEWPPTN